MLGELPRFATWFGTARRGGEVESSTPSMIRREMQKRIDADRKMSC